MSTPTATAMGVDARGQRILRFQSEAHNLSRLSLLLDLIVDMFESGDWRTYTTALGRERWRACEFDYFLIASEISYADAKKVFTWKERGRALAAATQSDDPRQRRSLEQASAAWRAPGPEPLAQRAERLGWTSARGVRSPAPARARAFVLHGRTAEAQARQARQRHLKDRRPELDQLIETLIDRVSDEAGLRYVVDRLRERLAKRRPPGRPKSDHDQWAQDVAALKGDAKALAQQWGLTKMATYKRLSKLITRNKFTRKAS